MKTDESLTAGALRPAIDRLWELSARKIEAIQRASASDTPVFTVDGTYTSRGWTEWTQGFQYGSALLQFDATGQERFLAVGKDGTRAVMASHVSHLFCRR